MSHGHRPVSRAEVLAHVICEWRSPTEVRVALGRGDTSDVARILEDLADGKVIDQQSAPITGLKYSIRKYRSWRGR